MSSRKEIGLKVTNPEETCQGEKLLNGTLEYSIHGIRDMKSNALGGVEPEGVSIKIQFMTCLNVRS